MIVLEHFVMVSGFFVLSFLTTKDKVSFQAVLIVRCGVANVIRPIWHVCLLNPSTGCALSQVVRPGVRIVVGVGVARNGSDWRMAQENVSDVAEAKTTNLNEQSLIMK